MKIELNREKELETILTLCVALVVFFFLTHQQHKWMLLASIVLGVIGMFSKFLTAKIAWAWMKLAEVMGNVNSRIILTVVFYVFLFPIAAVSKVFGNKSSLQLKKSNGDSYFFSRNHKFESKDLENGW